MEYKLVYERKRDTIGTFKTLKAAQKAAKKYEIEHKSSFTSRDYDFFDMCFIITATPQRGLNLKTYYRRLVENGPDKEWVLEQEVLVKKFTYRGVKIWLYDDDAGQCYYFRYRNSYNHIETMSCGGWNPDYMPEVRYYIDEMLDNIAGGDMFKPYYGTQLKYINKKHTRARLTHRLEVVKDYDCAGMTKEELYKIAVQDIEAFCNTPAYLKAEEERLQAIKNGDRGKMYFTDLIREEMEEKEENE